MMNGQKVNPKSWLGLFTLILLLVMILLLPACTTIMPDDSDGMETPQEPPAETGAPIIIAVTAPMAHISGEHIWWHCSIAAEEINEAGGIKVGEVFRPINLVKVDTNELFNVSDATAAVERAILVDNVDFVVGSWSTEAVIAMREVVMDHKMIYISEGTSPVLSDSLFDDYNRYKYWFSAYYPAEAIAIFTFPQLPIFAELVRSELGEEPKIAVVMDQALWVEPILAAAEGVIANAGYEQVGTWRPSTTATDLSAELLAIKESGANIIFHVMYGPSSLVFAKQWGELQIPAALIGISGEAPYEGFFEASDGQGDYLVTVGGNAAAALTENTVAYVDKFKKTTGEAPQYVWVHFYDAMYRLKEAIEAAGTIDSDAIVDELEQQSYLGVMGRYECYGPDDKHPHFIKTGSELVYLTSSQYQSGKLEVIWPPLDGSWDGVVIEGAKEPKLPPWMY